MNADNEEKVQLETLREDIETESVFSFHYLPLSSPQILFFFYWQCYTHCQYMVRPQTIGMPLSIVATGN